MQTRILGTTMPVLEVDLNPDESVFSESGELSWMTASIGMTTHTQMGGGGGFFGVLKRAAAGASIFMTEYRAVQYPGSVSFATKVPGHIVPVELGQGQEYLVHRHGFLCATPQVTITLGFQQSLGAGIFGGDGFLLQRVGGVGTAWLELSGELVQKNLAPGEVLRVHPGHVGAFQASVGFHDHHGSRHQEHDLWLRWNFSRAVGRSRRGLAADVAHLAPRPPDLRVFTQSSGGGAGRRRRIAGRHRRLDHQRRPVKSGRVSGDRC